MPLRDLSRAKTPFVASVITSGPRAAIAFDGAAIAWTDPACAAELTDSERQAASVLLAACFVARDPERRGRLRRLRAGWRQAARALAGVPEGEPVREHDALAAGTLAWTAWAAGEAAADLLAVASPLSLEAPELRTGEAPALLQAGRRLADRAGAVAESAGSEPPAGFFLLAEEIDAGAREIRGILDGQLAAWSAA